MLQNQALIVAEIGINHNGDMQLAKKMIRAAAKAGANAVKFQNYRTEDFITDKTLVYTYKSKGETVTESQFEMFKRCELSYDNLVYLQQCCADEEIDFFSTPTSIEGIQTLKELGAKWLKNGSDYLGHLPLIKEMGATGIPTILSTGMATENEISEAVEAFRSAGGKELVLLACTSAYPADRKYLNLRRINTLEKRYKCSAGFSDHSLGWEAAVAAVCLGACMIEKHFTIDQELPGPDQWFSCTPDELKQLVSKVREAEVMMGAKELKPTQQEVISRKEFRLSCVAAKNMSEGEIIKEQDIDYKRPANGMPPSKAVLLLNRRLAKAISKGEIFSLENLMI